MLSWIVNFKQEEVIIETFGKKIDKALIKNKSDSQVTKKVRKPKMRGKISFMHYDVSCKHYDDTVPFSSKTKVGPRINQRLCRSL